jgi:predicted esterase
MDSQPAELIELSVESPAWYLLAPPASGATSPALVLATHGYGMRAEVMLDLVQTWLGSRHWVASIEAPYPVYLGAKPGEGQEGFHWGTKTHWKAGVELHHRILHRVLAECVQRTGVPASRTVLLGFSQPVGLNYRFIATYPDSVGGVIGVCGGPPRDWEDNPDYKPVPAALLHIARDQDEYYPVDVVNRFEGRLKTRASDVEFHLLPGPHRFPSAAKQIALRWLDRVAGRGEFES